MIISSGSALSFTPDNSRSWVISIRVLKGERAGTVLVAPVIGWAVVVGHQPHQVPENERSSDDLLTDTRVEAVVIGHEAAPETESGFTSYGAGNYDLTWEIHHATEEEWVAALEPWYGPANEVVK